MSTNGNENGNASERNGNETAPIAYRIVLDRLRAEIAETETREVPLARELAEVRLRLTLLRDAERNLAVLSGESQPVLIPIPAPTTTEMLRRVLAVAGQPLSLAEILAALRDVGASLPPTVRGQQSKIHAALYRHPELFTRPRRGLWTLRQCPEIDPAAAMLL